MPNWNSQRQPLPVCRRHALASYHPCTATKWRCVRFSPSQMMSSDLYSNGPSIYPHPYKRGRITSRACTGHLHGQYLIPAAAGASLLSPIALCGAISLYQGATPATCTSSNSHCSAPLALSVDLPFTSHWKLTDLRMYLRRFWRPHRDAGAVSQCTSLVILSMAYFADGPSIFSLD